MKAVHRSRCVALAVLLLGGSVLLGWAYSLPSLTALAPGLASMKANTALCFVLVGIGLVLVPWDLPRTAQLAQACASLVFVIAFLTLLEHLAGFDFGIDNIVFVDPGDARNHPGRMALATSIAFIASAVGLFSLPHASNTRPYHRRAATAGSIVVAIIGLQGLLGYAIGLDSLYSSPIFGTVALHTGAGFVVLGWGLWLAGAQWRAMPTDDVRIAQRATGLVILVSSVIGITSLGATKAQAKQVLIKAFEATLYARTAQIRSSLRTRALTTASLAARPSLLRPLRSLAKNPLDTALLASIQEELDSYSLHDFSGIVVTDPRGVELKRSGKPIELAPWTLRLEAPLETSLLWRDGVYVRYELPLADAQGHLGTMRVEQFMLETTQGLLQANAPFGESMELLLCGVRRSDFQCFPSHLSREPVRLNAGSGVLASVVQRAHTGDRGFAAGLDSHGHRVLVGYAPVGTLGLVTLLKADAAEYYRPLGRQYQLMLLLIAASSIAGYFLVLRWVRPLAASLEQRVQARTAELSAANVELTRSEERFRTVVEFAPAAMVAVDAKGKIVLVNSRTEQLFGYDRSELLDRPVEVLVPEHSRGSHATLRSDYFDHPRARPMGEGRNLYALCKDGSVLTVEIGLSPIRTEGGVVVLASIVDLSESVRQAAVLTSTNEALQRSNIELQRFAYVASHDLQTPMRSIASFLGLLRSTYGETLDAQANDWIRRSLESVTALRALVRDLLEYSRLGSEARRFAAVDFCKVFDQTIGLLEAEIRETGARVTRGELPVVTGDCPQLVQLMLNLIGNAIKYRGAAAPLVHVAAQRLGQEWKFSVSDNGIGIAPRHHEQIFEMFKRLHTPKEFPGTGIGLSVCRRIVQLHGGRLWVESESGKGSTFYFTIPADEEIPDVQQSDITRPAG